MLRLEEENIYAGVATSGSGGGGSGGDDDSKDVRVLQAFSVVDKTDDDVYSVEWTVEKPDLQYDTYVSTFTFNNKSGNKYVFTAGETTKDGVVKGHPHIAGWFTFYDSTQSTAFDLPEFTYDSETGEYSAELDGYEFSFSITEESETQDSFVGGLVYKNGVELGDFNLGFWNEPLPLKKGSFDSATQQLTLNYDYLVEMINSSTATTTEQKSTMIALLNNQSPVIDMSTDTSIPNQYIYGFIPTGGTIPVGLQVDKATPCMIKLTFTGESVGGLGSWQAIADYSSAISGETVTPEMIEAMYSPLVVDKSFCTVSGTLGNFSVKFDKDEPEKPIVEKYGATVGNFLGDVDSNGVLQAPTLNMDLVFKGVKKVDNPFLLFPSQVTSRNSGYIDATPVVKSVSFPDLEEVNSDGFRKSFEGSGVQSVSFPKLKYIRRGSANNQYAFSRTFYGGSHYYNGQYIGGLTSVSFPELEEISGINYVFQATFEGNRNLTSISFPKLKKAEDCSYQCFTYCPLTSVEFPELQEVSLFRWFQSLTTLTSISLPKLSKFGIYGLQEAFSYCSGLTSMIFPSLSDMTSTSQGLKNTFQKCTSLTSVSFPALTSTSFGRYTSQFNNMLSGVTGCTVHFPSNLQSVIGSWSDVTAGFGGTNTTVLFDLPATE